MIELTHTKIHAGLEKPVKVLHVTDVHLTFANEEDTPEQHALMAKRFKTFETVNEQKLEQIRTTVEQRLQHGLGHHQCRCRLRPAVETADDPGSAAVGCRLSGGQRSG